MILIKVTADQERLIRRASSEQELRGIKDLMIDMLDRAHVLKSFGTVETLKSRVFSWKDALAVLREVCGETNITVPPFPDPSWYGRIQGYIRRGGLGPDETRELGEYVRDHLRLPSSLDFILGQRHQITAGRYDVSKPVEVRAGYVPVNRLGPELPKE